jgi:hypothetical protein
VQNLRFPFITAYRADRSVNQFQHLMGAASSARAEEAARKPILLAGSTETRTVDALWHSLGALPVFVCTSILLLGRDVVSNPQSY